MESIASGDTMQNSIRNHPGTDAALVGAPSRCCPMHVARNCVDTHTSALIAAESKTASEGFLASKSGRGGAMLTSGAEGARRFPNACPLRPDQTPLSCS
eukprot:6203920-Pleurochrysis_carterae.AAC.2